MTVNTTDASRRDLGFASLEEALADAETIAAGPYETTGNWSYAQIIDHLAKSLIANLDGVEAKPPLFVRPFMPLLYPTMKRMVFGQAMKPGIETPKIIRPQFWPGDDPDLGEALALYRSAVHRALEANPIPKHPFFGEMTQDELLLLHRRHADLHLSFVRPLPGSSDEPGEAAVSDA